MSAIDVAELVASWLSVLVTAIGLCTLAIQADVIRAQLDPFYKARGPEQLGRWVRDEKEKSGFSSLLSTRVLRGPTLKGDLKGLNGLNEIYLSRLPVGSPGRDYGSTTWTKMCHVFHSPLLTAAPVPSSEEARRGLGEASFSVRQNDIEIGNRQALEHRVSSNKSQNVPCMLPGTASWHLKNQELVLHEQKASIKISPITFVVLLVLSNAYKGYMHNGDSGLRAWYFGYTGTWSVMWPIGRPAVVQFLGLNLSSDSHDPFPKMLKRRVYQCLLMFVGMVCGGSVGKMGFPDEDDEARSVLDFHEGGGGGGATAGHSRSHLYYLLGGEPFEADFLVRRPIPQHETAPDDALSLTMPAASTSLDLSQRPLYERRKTAPALHVTVFVPSFEQEKLATALDCLPWSHLSWSTHGGMQSLLLAYGEEVMKFYRSALARTLEHAAREHAYELKCRGWEPGFVDDKIPRVVKTRILQMGGDSGDSVRIVTDVALLLCRDTEGLDLDETRFWRKHLMHHRSWRKDGSEGDLMTDAIVALIKYWVLEWSHDLDYRICEVLPNELLFS